MQASDAIQFMSEALYLVLMLSAPAIIAASVVGLIIAIVQAATQIQEQTIQFTIKFFVVVVALFVSAAMIGGALYEFGDKMFTQFPYLVQ
ncbi:MAG: type III secretion system export apparatus subunit SctS [Aquisalinus sp.]|nr:type III secretion system export apparatus subunit SctS [Aquisalinus sp.]